MRTELKQVEHNTRWHVVRDANNKPVSVAMAFDDFKVAFPGEAANILSNAVPEASEDAELIQLADEVKNDELIPVAVIARLVDGENPVKVYREFRDLTQPELAEKAGISTNYVSMIETGKKTASRKLQAKLAGILRVDYDDLDTWEAEEFDEDSIEDWNDGRS
ncbi:MAG: helix-turn-helix domain-containing protein [Pseudomonadota bacterium]